MDIMILSSKTGHTRDELNFFKYTLKSKNILPLNIIRILK